MALSALRSSKQPSNGKRATPLSPKKAIKAVCEGRLAEYLDKKAIDEIYRAYYFAEKAHHGQVRKSGEHYIHHPIEVADTLAELQMDGRSIVAALLHDVIEDSVYTKEVLAEQFGDDVALLVDGVSKIGQIDFDSKEHAESENFRKMLMAMSQDVRVMIIKLADRLHNMRTLSSMSADKQKRISRQTIDVYAPIAERLGLYHWARELQDLCFQYLYPKRYNAIKKEIKKREGNRKQIVAKLMKSLNEVVKNSPVPDVQIIGRRKSVYSIYKKMLKKRRSFAELHDIYGFRIIVNTVDECYRVLGVIHNNYKPIPRRFSDYIAIPKVNGYQSLHTVVFGPFGDNIEVQIRTEEMNRIAEAGVAAHWIYKSDEDPDVKPQHLARQWLLDILDPVHQSGNPKDFLEHLKTDLYPDEVYVFTPKGDIKKLPRGATALDFAYAVHTDVGTHCTGARINRVLASLPTVLQNGDHVEIMTSKQACPNTVWLNYTVTARARSGIRHYLKNQRREDALKLGKRLLAGSLKQGRFFRKKVGKKTQQALLDKLNVESWDDLLIDMGLGIRIPDMVVRQIGLLEDDGQQDGVKKAEPALLIRGSEGLLVTYSRCCHPIPGDPLIGTFTAGHGLVVHTNDCPNMSELRKQPENCLMVEWDQQIEKEFSAKIRVHSLNKRGFFALLATAITEQESNIVNVEVIENADNSHYVDFLIEVKDRIHLAQVIKAIRVQDGVIKVSRQKG